MQLDSELYRYSIAVSSSPPVGGYSMLRIVADLEIALDRLGVHGPVVLVGHSFGGSVRQDWVTLPVASQVSNSSLRCWAEVNGKQVILVFIR